jgi:hypothetical protein
MIKAVLFDFGGVLAEEGFTRIAGHRRKNGLDPEAFFKTVDSLIYEEGILSALQMKLYSGMR